RQIKVNISVPGYRSRCVYLLTTLLDSKAYPAEYIAELYRQRWRVEVFFRDIKTTLGMEVLRGKTPAIVEKEVQMFFIVNNIIRLLVLDSQQVEDLQDKSFKCSIQLLL